MGWSREKIWINDSYGWICISNPRWCWRLGSYVIPSYEIWWDKVGCREKVRNKSSKDRNKTISHIGLKTTLGQVNIDAKKTWEHCAKIVYKWYQGKPIQVLMIGYIYIYILSLSLSQLVPRWQKAPSNPSFDCIVGYLSRFTPHQGWLVEHQTQTGIVTLYSQCLQCFPHCPFVHQFEWLLGYIQ